MGAQQSCCSCSSDQVEKIQHSTMPAAPLEKGPLDKQHGYREKSNETDQEAVEDAFRKPKTTKADSKKAKFEALLKKVRNTVLRAVQHLRKFQKFMIDQYGNYNDAFDDIVEDGSTHVALTRFVRRVRELKFKGDVEAVFYAICTENWDFDGLVIPKQQFCQRLATIGNGSFISVVQRLVVEARKAKASDEDAVFSSDVKYDRALKDFRHFLRPLFSNPGAVFDKISRGNSCVEPEDFKAELKKLGFGGDFHLVWVALCEGHEGRTYLSRDNFTKVITSNSSKKQDGHGSSKRRRGSVTGFDILCAEDESSKASGGKGAKGLKRTNSMASSGPQDESKDSRKETRAKSSNALKRTNSTSSLSTTADDAPSSKSSSPASMNR